MNFVDEVIAFLIKTTTEVLGKQVDNLSADTSFKEDLNCKSVDIVHYTAELEAEYDVEVPFMAFNRCRTFRDAAEYLKQITGFE